MKRIGDVRTTPEDQLSLIPQKITSSMEILQWKSIFKLCLTSHRLGRRPTLPTLFVPTCSSSSIRPMLKTQMLCLRLRRRQRGQRWVRKGKRGLLIHIPFMPTGPFFQLGAQLLQPWLKTLLLAHPFRSKMSSLTCSACCCAFFMLVKCLALTCSRSRENA